MEQFPKAGSTVLILKLAFNEQVTAFGSGKLFSQLYKAYKHNNCLTSILMYSLENKATVYFLAWSM